MGSLRRAAILVLMLVANANVSAAEVPAIDATSPQDREAALVALINAGDTSDQSWQAGIALLQDRDEQVVSAARRLLQTIALASPERFPDAMAMTQSRHQETRDLGLAILPLFQQHIDAIEPVLIEAFQRRRDPESTTALVSLTALTDHTARILPTVQEIWSDRRFASLRPKLLQSLRREQWWANHPDEMIGMVTEALGERDAELVTTAIDIAASFSQSQMPAVEPQLLALLTSSDREIATTLLESAAKLHPKLSEAGRGSLMEFLQAAAGRGGRAAKQLAQTALDTITSQAADRERIQARQQAAREESAISLLGLRWAASDQSWSDPLTLSSDRGTVTATFTAGDHGKSALQTPESWNWSGLPRVSLTLINGGEAPVDVALAVKIGNAWTYFESAPHTVPPGEEPAVVEFDMVEGQFKSEGRSWQFQQGINASGTAKETVILIYHHGSDGSIVIESISAM